MSEKEIEQYRYRIRDNKRYGDRTHDPQRFLMVGIRQTEARQIQQHPVDNGKIQRVCDSRKDRVHGDRDQNIGKNGSYRTDKGFAENDPVSLSDLHRCHQHKKHYYYRKTVNKDIYDLSVHCSAPGQERSCFHPVLLFFKPMHPDLIFIHFRVHPPKEIILGVAPGTLRVSH